MTTPPPLRSSPLARVLCRSLVWLAFLALVPASLAQTFTDVAHFPIDGRRIQSPLVQGPDGNFYGTTTYGGPDNLGTVFKITPAGVKTTVAAFLGPETVNNGQYPLGALVVGTDGSFYGATTLGGAEAKGTVFKMTAAGVLTKLLDFTGAGTANRGAAPAGLTLGPDGNFYGVTYAGGAGDAGTVFRMTPAGALTTLVEFARDHGSPLAPLTLGRDGNFYGTTTGNEDVADFGTVFKMTPAGVLTTLVSFTGAAGVAKGEYPATPLVEGPDDFFYGTTWRGSTGNHGTAFKVSPAGAFASLADLAEGFGPSGFTLGPDGNFYAVMQTGNTAAAAGSVFRMTPAGLVTTLVEFTRQQPLNRGGTPIAELILASDGNFYGSFEWGSGTSDTVGSVFKLTAAGALTTLAEFHLAPLGSQPIGGLRLGANGHFYGLAKSGGDWNSGTAFEVTPVGVLTTLTHFPLQPEHWGSPRGRLLRAADGDFYGVTSVSSNGPLQDPGFPGFAFKLTAAGVRTLVYDFDRGRSEQPEAGLMQTPDGRIYGTSTLGPEAAAPPRHPGSVYRLDPGGSVETTALLGPGFSGTFGSGRVPVAEVVLGPDDQLYGSTRDGGAFSRGTLFKTPRFEPTGRPPVTTLVEFTGNGATNKGGEPLGELMLATDGNFYGMTSRGGGSNLGTIFKLTPAGVLTTLVEFTGNGPSNKGASPDGGLIQAADGNFYGVTPNGGASGLGTVFQMTPAGVLTTIHEFSDTDGARPTGTFAADATGSVLYGITRTAGFTPTGIGGGGTVFRIALGTSAALQAITVTPPAASVAAGLTQQFTATGQYSDGSAADLTATATWQSSAPGVATLDGAGLATSVAEGTATVTATHDGESGSATLTVTPAVLLSLAVEPAAASVEAGQTQQFTAVAAYSDGGTVDLTREVRWKSSNTRVARIAASGLATGVGGGTATITATERRRDGLSAAASLEVIVVNRPPIAADDRATTRAGRAVTIRVLGNDRDPDRDRLTVTDIPAPPASGTAAINMNGTITYTPAAGFTGTDSFQYQISDGRGGTATATVTVMVR